MGQIIAPEFLKPGMIVRFNPADIYSAKTTRKLQSAGWIAKIEEVDIDSTDTLVRIDDTTWVHWRKIDRVINESDEPDFVCNNDRLDSFLAGFST